MNTNTVRDLGLRVLVWDAPVRVCHWLLVVCLIGALVTTGSDAWAEEHLAFEVVAAALAVFRIVWSVFGTGYAHWRHVLYRPVKIWRAAWILACRRGELYPTDPVRGSLQLLLIVTMLVVGVTGVVAELHAASYWVSGAHGLASSLLYVIAATHLAVVLYASWIYGENLMRCMVTGKYQAPEHEAVCRVHRPAALALGVGTVALWLGLSS